MVKARGKDETAEGIKGVQWSKIRATWVTWGKQQIRKRSQPKSRRSLCPEAREEILKKKRMVNNGQFQERVGSQRAGKRPLDLPIYLNNYNSPISGRTQIQSLETRSFLAQSQIQINSHGRERVTKLLKLLFRNIKPAFLFINSDLKFNFMVQ